MSEKDKDATTGTLIDGTNPNYIREDEEMPTDEELKLQEEKEEARLAKQESNGKKPRKQFNYVLEVMVDGKDGDPRMWKEVKDGFVSPKQALKFISKTKVQGVFRVVRVASSEYEVKLVTPEPVLEIKRRKV